LFQAAAGWQEAASRAFAIFTQEDLSNMARLNDAHRFEEALAKVTDESSFIQKLLIEALDWPIEGKRVDDVSYQWSEKELRAAGLEAKVVDSRIFQIANLDPNQPWGVFVIEFKHSDAFLAERGMTGVLRQVLRGLVPSARKDASQPSWKREHLLFICTHNYEHYRIAYFKAPPEGTKTAPLAAFGWGPDIPRRTACEFNLPALQWPDDPKDGAAWIAAWAEAFNVEKVTKRFYTDYAADFEKLRAAVKPLKGEDQKMFTQALMNRLMFLRFIERKGWLTPPGGERSKDYLRLLFQAGGYRGKSFYVGRLRKLFFEALAIEGKQESEAVGKVAFLNGGLFEESDVDKDVADIPDAAFAPLLGADGLLYRYNFTVQESTPLDIEVAVDPEMLGKVLEELVTGRHECGSYYTPRPVVSFMCREAIKGYLAASLNAYDDAIAELVDHHNASGLTLPLAREIIKALDAVRAVDPACGSGAYLLGLLHELVDLYRLLYSDKLKVDDRALHEIKLDIIQNSLYGTDIDPFATNIAMLRLWLSLAVDTSNPQPLPNLDFKIETGNSVTGPDPQSYTELFLTERARQLAILKGQYMRAHGQTKQSLRRLVQKEQRELAFELRSLSPGAIDWRVQFCEVFFSERGGFDIVLANPPYIRQELIKEYKPRLRQVFGPLFCGTADLYVFFYLRALQLLVFISSNKWFRAGYGEKLRSLIARTTSVRTILDFHDLPVFESAIAYPMIFVAAKTPPATTHQATFAEPPTLEPPYPNVAAVVGKFGQRLPRTALGNDGNWHLASAEIADRLTKMRRTGTTLGEYVHGKIYRGVLTGFNEAFVVDGEKRAELIAADPSCAEIIKPLAVGKDLKRWRVETRDKWLIVTKIGIAIKNYPAIFKHLKQFQRPLEVRQDQGDHWWKLRACGYYDEFDVPKIVYPVIAERPTFALDARQSFVNDKCYMISTDDRFLLAVLNSSHFWAFVQGVCPHFKVHFLRCVVRRPRISPSPPPPPP
jgi:hypothetical protein